MLFLPNSSQEGTIPMKDDKKSIILNEIHFWKSNRMLPEHYCDYLIALYSEGEEVQEVKKNKKKIVSKETIFSLLFLTIIILMIVITYITAISFGMQTLFLSLFVIILLASLYYFKKKELNPMVIYITAAFLMLLYSVQIHNAFFDKGTISLYILLLINSFFWIIGGIWGKRLFFIISGSIAMLLLLFLIFRP